MTLEQTTMWLCCKLLRFHRPSLCDLAWPTPVHKSTGQSDRTVPEPKKFVFKITAQGLKCYTEIMKWGWSVKETWAKKNLRSDAGGEEKIYQQNYEKGCKSKIDIALMKALTGRQKCLVALRYDAVVSSVSTNEVSHTRHSGHIWKSNYGTKDVLAKTMTGLFQQLTTAHLLEAKLWLMWGRHMNTYCIYSVV